MRLFTWHRLVYYGLPLLATTVSAERVIESTALAVCQSNSSFTASLFNVVFTPGNGSLSLDVVGDSSITGNISLHVEAAAYGYTFLTETVDPCAIGLTSLCPLQQIQISFNTVYPNLSKSVISNIPGIAYGVPDLDATITVHAHSNDNPTVSLACVQLKLSNRKTVDQSAVSWATAAIACIGLLAAALVSGLGHSNAASHVSLYASSLFGYFQAIAIIGLCAVPLPPIVQSWTQNFSWSMGIIRVGFLQDLATWYQIATGGTPSTILTTLDVKSVQVLKRSVELAESAHRLYSRATQSVSDSEYIVKGIKRVAFRAGMESTNLFLTGLIFFCVFIIFATLAITIFKWLCEFAMRAKWMSSYRFQNLRQNYHTTLKGLILRILLIGYPQMTLLCLWEFTQVDSSGEVFLAVIFLLGMSAAIALATFNVIRIAKRSELKYHTPAYLLYTDVTTLKKWGFLYIPFRASAYYYIMPTLAYIFVKAAFVGGSQKSGVTQAIALVIIEGAALIGASVVRPWMDKPSNGINIAICVVNFLNAIFLLIFTGIFGGPGLLIGVVGIIFFVANAVFALALLIIVLVAVTFSIIQKNPETRYQPVADNRASFIKSQTGLTAELEALGLTARGGTNSDQEKSRLGDGENYPQYTAPTQHQYNLAYTDIPESQHSHSSLTSGRPSPTRPHTGSD
ncbi:TRP-domain-containing protein [Coleophoma crateriformis]|uniref:TRP-domain-containing protein n=1 Tax=Coleophoma crateriformis TaxID=565419 RepID=A0A3D8Q778_9HELO|nr:TRP-domain-containing protein [Coleophoma crateriformis]